MHEITQDHGGKHGGGHAPFVETCGDIQARGIGGISADIRHIVQPMQSCVAQWLVSAAFG